MTASVAGSVVMATMTPSRSAQPSSQTRNLLLLPCGWGIRVGTWEPLDWARNSTLTISTVSWQNSTLTIEEFHSKLQEATNFPLRPFVIPFLKVNRGSTLQATGMVYAKAPRKGGKLLRDGWNPVRGMGEQRVKNGW